MLDRKKRKNSPVRQVIISLSSPDKILERSHGEVTKPETRNHRTHKPEPGGLFCERIFGPEEDYKCACRKYKGIKYKGTICDRCGVEVNERKVRRGRMGHARLAVPVVHIWYQKSMPSKIAGLLGITGKELENVVYYSSYIVVQPGIKAAEGMTKLQLLSEREHSQIKSTLPPEQRLLPDSDPDKFIAKMGGEAVEMLLKRVELETLAKELREQIIKETSQQRRAEALKRLRIVEAFRDGQRRRDNKPEWMVLRELPIISPELRPLIKLGPGKTGLTDLTDSYQRLIRRNDRCKEFIEARAPDIITRSQKRLVQEAVDALFDNSKKMSTSLADNGRPLKSLSDNLKGKKGRFRYNLLGKRVDYSGRSVIVVGPELKLHECGLPKEMAAELFKPFIIRRLLDRGLVHTVKDAKRFIDHKDPVIWEILSQHLEGHPVLLNRAPTLHKLSIQAFQPKLIEGKAIQLHPLVCTAFNADFDGDQMAVHIPLGQEAIAEAAVLMLSSNNIINPSNGEPIVVPTKDMILGLYYLTKGRRSTPDHPVKGEGRLFADQQEVLMALDSQQIDKRAFIKVRITSKDDQGELKQEIIECVAGSVIFNRCVPDELGFINELLTNKKVQKIVAKSYQVVGSARTAHFLDDLKDLGFQYAYLGGLTIGLNDIKPPAKKEAIIEQAKEEEAEVWENYQMGVITSTERSNQVIDIWGRATNRVTRELIHELSLSPDNSVYMMMDSGARGSREQIRQLGGMKGMIAKPQKSNQGNGGGIIEIPILGNFIEGLKIDAYFNSTPGSRKGLSDTALKTAEAGYLFRKLEVLAQNITVMMHDCGALLGVKATALYDQENLVRSLEEVIAGRVLLNDVLHPQTGELLARRGEMISSEEAQTIQQAGVSQVLVRSVLTCEAPEGVCAKCYGKNLTTRALIHEGEAVGIVAAQSIAEPGTQLTLRTFHIGGAATKVMEEAKLVAPDSGVVRFDHLQKAVITDPQGLQKEVVIGKSCALQILEPETGRELASLYLPYTAHLDVREGQHVKKGDDLCHWDQYNALILAGASGTVDFESIEAGVTYREEYDEQTGYREKIIIDTKDKTKNPNIVITDKRGEKSYYNMPVQAYLSVEQGQQVHAGQILAKIPRKLRLSHDITGGLPRVIGLFEARTPSEAAVMCEIDGLVSYGEVKRGNREIRVRNKIGIEKRYMVPVSKHILVQDGDFIKSGSPLSDNLVTISSIASVKGREAVQQHIVESVQEVYRFQGVRIDNKHMELIVKQMMTKVEILDPGDTHFLPKEKVIKGRYRELVERTRHYCVITQVGDSLFTLGQQVSANQLEEENQRLEESGQEKAQARPFKPPVSRVIIQGITRASLDSDSFLAAASFQQAIPILSDAAIAAKVDNLKGLQERVIVGGIIPAGTGHKGKDDKALLITGKEEYKQLLKV